MTTTEQSIAAVLDDTITALSVLDLERLLLIEEKLLLLPKTGITGASIPSLLERQQILGRVLEVTHRSLQGLDRLQQRKGADTWER